MPLAHMTSDGSDAVLAPSMKSLRNMRRYMSRPPCSVVRSADEKAALGTWPLTTWYAITSGHSGMQAPTGQRDACLLYTSDAADDM
eukprot:1354102-Prymnesium_polylepis.1